eukprot:9556177-Lingulodinium_polyedra.AAC.1
MRVAGIVFLLLATTAAPPPRVPAPINAPRPMIPGTGGSPTSGPIITASNFGTFPCPCMVVENWAGRR